MSCQPASPIPRICTDAVSSAAMGPEETLYKRLGKNPVSRSQVVNVSRHRSQLNQSRGALSPDCELLVVLDSNIHHPSPRKKAFSSESSAESKT